MKLRLNYFIIPVLVFLVLYIGSIFTSGNMEWYNALVLPKMTPEKWVFPVVWNVIGVLTALSALLWYNRAPRDINFFLVYLMFVTNGILNITWTKVFFGWHNSGLAWFVALALAFNLLALIGFLGARSRIAAALLVPYALWVFFALFLNWQVWLLN